MAFGLIRTRGSPSANSRRKPTALYALHSTDNGVYVFMIKGSTKIAGIELNKHDGLGVWDIDKIEIEVNAESEILLMEAPMFS
ncbi:hypothetical protein [Aggregatibacter kilianii]|uniref:pirin family protein n=1 Tax=Aggregatibacter kilianii TaxID=2025884 RepID=UPI0013A6193E|nr:hypothetical protein [Aggregatibacter kilianii]